jgi:hypothetical protein
VPLDVEHVKKPKCITAHNTELSHIHIHLTTNLIYKNDHTSTDSVDSLKLGYNLQNVIRDNLKIIIIVSTKKTVKKMEHIHNFLFQSH